MNDHTLSRLRPVKSQVALNGPRRNNIGTRISQGDAARTIRKYLTETPALKSVHNKYIKEYLNDKQMQLRAAEAREMGLGPPALIQEQLVKAAGRLKQVVEARIIIPIAIAKGRDKYQMYMRFPLDADTDRLVALYRTEAKKLGMEIIFLPDQGEKTATGTLSYSNNSDFKLPDEITNALNTLTDPSSLQQLDPKNLHIGQGGLGTCYLWAAVISVAARNSEMFKTLLSKVTLSESTAHTIAEVRAAVNQTVTIRRSDFVRHFNERLICEYVGEHAAPGQKISELIPPTQLLLLELAEAELRRQEDSKVVKGLGAVGGWSRDFLGNFLPGKKVWLDSIGGRSTNGKFEYSSLPFTDMQIIKNLKQALILHGNNSSFALMAATLNRVSKNDLVLNTSAGPLYRNHEYAVAGYDTNENKIKLVNPWDSEKVITLPFDEFCKNFAVLEGFEFKK